MPLEYVVITAIIALAAAGISFFLGITYRKMVGEKEISSAEEEARRIINEAIKASEGKKREALLEAKEEILHSRTEYEKEEKSRRADLQKQERRLQQKEENLDRKTENIEKKEEALVQKHADADRAQEEIELIKRSQTEMLERISGFTVEEAKNYLIAQVETEVTHETALKIKEIEQRAKEEADQRAKEIVATAIQRCAADHASEITVSVVPLPNDEMKGRIIGREGRNIRTIETLTGVDLIIDDTPEAITVSCFEPVRREVARVALEKLIADGRIHPTHIEEMVEKARREVEQKIRQDGERAVIETGVHSVHPELMKLLGRMRYRTSYGQNVLNHSVEVSQLTGVDLIIDDTPEAITVSCFEPVRREVARVALEKLIADGRIHPTHIEEMVEKAKREVDAVIKSEGERAAFETGVRGLHPEVQKMLGRLHYRTSYGQNVLQHSIEVSHIAGLMASELGLDVHAAKRAGLLHDIGKALDHEYEGTHVNLGVEFCRKYKEKEDILNAIQAHHGDVECKTLMACLVQAADAVSAARPGARRENLENYIKRLEKLEEIAKSFNGVDKCYAIQAGREIRVILKPEIINDDQMVITARDIVKKIENEMEYPGQIKVHVIRETRAIEYAK